MSSSPLKEPHVFRKALSLSLSLSEIKTATPQKATENVLL